MDPLTALGLASNIIQFISFAGKLISESQEAFEAIDGLSQRNANLENISHDLIKLHQQLARDAYRSPEAILSVAEEQLQCLVSESVQTAEKLIGTVQTLRSYGQNKRWKSVKHALSTVWKQKDIAALQARLSEIRQQLDTTLLICLRERLDESAKPSSPVISHARRQSDVSTLCLKDIKTQQQEILRFVRQYRHSLDEHQIQKFSVQLETTAELSIESRFANLMLSHLEFAEIQDRYERICQAHSATFGWIYREPDDSRARWEDFPKWLSTTGEEDNFYWITGKAGSGKSTLMKYIFDDERTLQHLQSWSGELPLLTAGFFFWNSGVDIQMSQTGLLRALIYQILKHQPCLLRAVFEKRWSTYQTLRGGFYEWTLSELKQALEVLAKNNTIRIALFIDGLDEFDGDHEDLAEFLLHISGPTIKVCAASRPWLVFEDAFEKRPNLLLEHLTRKDIRLYVADAFASNKYFAKLENVSKAQTSDLVESIVNKASGVFLWVHLVVRSLLQGMANADRMSELKRRLDSLPTGLEELFDKLLRSLDSFYFPHAAQLIRILKTAPVPPMPLEMSFADEEDLDAAIHAEIRPLTTSEKAERSESMRRRLNSRCKGLLGVWQYGNSSLERVEFLHRTVKDFFDKPDIWASIMEATPESFDPYQCWSSSLMMELKTIDIDPDMTLPSDLFRLIQWAIQHVEQSEEATREWQTRYLDELNRTIEELVHRNSTLGMWSMPECFSSGTCFLDLIYQHGMSFYVQQKLSDKTFKIDEEDLDILLDTVANSTSPRASEIVQLILDRGGSFDRAGLSTCTTLSPEITEVYTEHKRVQTMLRTGSEESGTLPWWKVGRFPTRMVTKVEGFWSL